MKFTNRYNLPTVFGRFEQANPHSPEGAKYTVSKLIDSPKIARLRASHSSDVTEDISGRVWALLGTAVHAVLEGGAESSQIVEERLHAGISGIAISGQIDLQTPHKGGWLISDYKTTRAFTVQASPDGKVEWLRQANCYAALARLNDRMVTGLEVIAIIRDWSAAAAGRSSDYPEAPIVRISLPMWDEEKAYEYLKGRIEMHEAEATEDCTDEEMWARPTVFAVHEQTKRGSLAKRAKRLFDSRTEAEIYSMNILGSKVIERPTVYTRCEGNYCNVAEFCDQFYNRNK